MDSIKDPGPTLYLIPVEIYPDGHTSNLPVRNHDIIIQIDEFIVENIRTARRALRSMGYKRDFESVVFHELNKHTTKEEISTFLQSTRRGKSIGLMSEAGNPCIADPGNIIVDQAHRMQIKVVPLVGPNSILLALIASGFNGQHFLFHGYIPIDKTERYKKLKKMQSDAAKWDQTQIFMETPFRNNGLLKDIIQCLDPATRLCIASDINSAEQESIITQTVAGWKKNTPDLNKRPSVFLISRP